MCFRSIFWKESRKKHVLADRPMWCTFKCKLCRKLSCHNKMLVVMMMVVMKNMAMVEMIVMMQALPEAIDSRIA